MVTNKRGRKAKLKPHMVKFTHKEFGGTAWETFQTQEQADGLVASLTAAGHTKVRICWAERK